MNRSDWQRIAEEKLLAADALLAAEQWTSAYYLAGYAIECGLKSCVLMHLVRAPEVIFERKTYSEKCWCHDVEQLVELANLKDDLKNDVQACNALGQNWLIVKDWSEQSRYEDKTREESQSLYNAIVDSDNGVMEWIRDRW